MATLGLNDGFRTKVWRVVKAALKDDKTYGDADIDLQFYEGDPGAIADLDTASPPIIQFFPQAGPQTWRDEAGIVGDLQVNVEVRLNVLDCEDIFNLQEALETTLDSLASTTLQADLIAAGATTGLILFSQPLRPMAGRVGSDNLFRLAGQFTVEVSRPLLP